MMMPEDFDVNPVQRYTDSLKEVVKQTMVNQNVLFRNQVHELHRLYRVQESLMKDFGWEECNRYNSWKHNVLSSLLPFTNPTRYEPLGKKPRFPSMVKVSLSHFLSHKSPIDCQGTYYKLPHRPLDLQLSADESINHVEEELPKKGNIQNSFGGPLEFPLSGGNSSNAEELKLSLSIGGDDSKMEDTMRTFVMKKTYSFSHNMIDLEESVNRMSDVCAKYGPSQDFAFLETHSKGKHELQKSFSKPFIQTSVRKDTSHVIAESNSFQEYSDCCQEQTSSSEGVRKCHDEVPSDDLSSKMQQLTSYRGHLDLNKVHSSCCSDDHILAYPSRESSEGGSDGLHGSMQDGPCPTMFQKKEIELPNEVSDVLKQDNTENFALVDLNIESMNPDIWTQNSENNCRSCDHKNETVELKSKLTREVSCEKSEVENAVFSCSDKSQNTVQDGQGHKSPASCKSYCISDNDSSSGKTTHSSITSDVLDQYIETHSGSQVAEVLTGEHDQRTSYSSDQNECYNKKEESAEVDVLIHNAAELLIHISSAHSACDQDSFAKVGCEEMENKDQPQCSLDSFELIALNLTESNLDDNTVSSMPFEVNNTDAKEFGLKLRRGRRMKDFQKEILPSLASLSRHEILEDVNIMEGVLRSREYRKNKAKMAACGENWSAPVRSRRSRVNHAGRGNPS